MWFILFAHQRRKEIISNGMTYGETAETLTSAPFTTMLFSAIIGLFMILAAVFVVLLLCAVLVGIIVLIVLTVKKNKKGGAK